MLGVNLSTPDCPRQTVHAENPVDPAHCGSWHLGYWAACGVAPYGSVATIWTQKGTCIITSEYYLPCHVPALH